MVTRILSRIKRGDIIPDFRLRNTAGATIASEQYSRKKNLIIFFFRRLQDNHCGAYLEMLNNIYEELKAQNAEVLAISCDKPEALKEFAANKKIKFNLLLDPEKETLNKFTRRDIEINNIGVLFIADKFSSLYKCYFHRAWPFGELPDKKELISSVEFLEKQCPECGVSTWPEDSG